MEKAKIEINEDEMLEIVTLMKMKIYQLEDDIKGYKNSLEKNTYRESFKQEINGWIEKNQNRIDELENFADSFIHRFNRGKIEDENQG